MKPLAKAFALLALYFMSGALLAVPGMDQRIYKALVESNEWLEQDAYQQALESLTSLTNRNLTNYEQGHLWNQTGLIHYEQSNYQGALSYYQQTLGLPDLPDSMRANTSKILAQIAMVQGDYQLALDTTTRMIDSDWGGVLVDSSLWAILANANYQLQNYSQAINALRIAVQMELDAGRAPREYWLQLVSASYHGLNDYSGMLQALQQLISYYPRPEYFNNLALVYGELGNSDAQLTISETLYEQGWSSDATRLRNLASLYLMKNIPFKAGNLLQEGLESGLLEHSERNFSMLAQAWFMAGEIEALIEPARMSAELDESGEGYMFLANNLISLERFDEAQEAIVAALEKGNLRDSGSAWVTLGMVEMHRDNFDQAKAAFAQAASFEDTEQLANNWNRWLQQQTAQRELLNP